MVGYAKRRAPRHRPSEDQRKFLELLRDLGPRDNAQTAAVRKATKRACQVRGWVEWRSLDNFPGMRAWHLTIIGQKALNRPVRPADSHPRRLNEKALALAGALAEVPGLGGDGVLRVEE